MSAAASSPARPQVRLALVEQVVYMSAVALGHMIGAPVAWKMTRRPIVSAWSANRS